MFFIMQSILKPIIMYFSVSQVVFAAEYWAVMLVSRSRSSYCDVRSYYCDVRSKSDVYVKQ